MNLATENQQLQHSKVAKAGPLPLQWSSSSALETQLYQFQLSSVGSSFSNMFQILILSDLEIEWFPMFKKEVLICRIFLVRAMAAMTLIHITRRDVRVRGSWDGWKRDYALES